MAEVCAERGYAECSVAEVSKRAGVSTASFYRQFKDKRECMLGSFENLLERLLEQVERVCIGEKDREASLSAGIQTAAALLSADPPAARLLSVEIIAAGTEGVRLQHSAIERLASLLRGSRVIPADGVDSAWTTAAALTAVVARRTVEGNRIEGGELEELLKRLSSS